MLKFKNYIVTKQSLGIKMLFQQKFKVKNVIFINYKIKSLSMYKFSYLH